MDTEKARIFLAVMNKGSLTAAAEQLGYTASGISRSIASLEDEIGIPLFIRGKKGVELTSDAELFVPIMRELVYQANKLKETADRIKGLEEGTLTIGISYAGYFKLIAEKLKLFTDKYPQIRIKTLQETSTKLLRALEHHEIDIAIMTYRESDYNFYVLRKDPMVACIPANHFQADKDVFPIKLFEKEGFIAPYPNYDTDYKRVFEQFGIRPNIQFTTMDIYAAYCMVETGLGCTLLNKLEVESWNGNVKMLHTEPKIDFEIGVLYPDTDNLSVVAKSFLDEFIKM